MVPGMFHCQTSGAWAFGQGALSGSISNRMNDTAHNILLALVDWVEGGIAPENITGVDDRLRERTHCRYPLTSIWKEGKWTCQRA
jgi:feruloyl esterase